MNPLKSSEFSITKNPKPQRQQKHAHRAGLLDLFIYYYSATAFASPQLPSLYFMHNILINFTDTYIYKLGFRTSCLFFSFKKAPGTNHVFRRLRIDFQGLHGLLSFQHAEV